MDNLFEGFEDINNLVPKGWAIINNSDPLGSTNWLQGNFTNFPSQAGPPDAYIAADFNNTGPSGTISNWLLTPTLNLFNGAEFSFYTRVRSDPVSPDRLQLRLSTNGSSMDVGNTADSVGDFNNLLIDINPFLTPNGYPEDWTKFSVTLTGLPLGAEGRFGFRYFVTDAGRDAPNSDYIGIDTVSYPTSSIPCVHPDTKVHTATGLKAISEIRAGDVVLNQKGKHVSVLYNMRFLPSNTFIRIKKGALNHGLNSGQDRGKGEDRPTNDILIRKGHPILYKGREVDPARLVGRLSGIEKETLEEPVRVWSLCTKDRVFILTEGIPVATWSEEDILSKKKFYFDKY